VIAYIKDKLELFREPDIRNCKKDWRI